MTALSVVVILTSVLSWRTLRLNELGRVICLVSVLEGHSFLGRLTKELSDGTALFKTKIFTSPFVSGKTATPYICALSSDIAVVP